MRCAIHTRRRMFRKGSLNPARLTFTTTLGRSGAQNRGQESREKHENAPSGTGAPRCNANSCTSGPQRSLKKAEMQTQYSPEETVSQQQKQNVNEHLGKHQNSKFIFRSCVCHVTLPPSAHQRPRLPHGAHTKARKIPNLHFFRISTHQRQRRSTIEGSKSKRDLSQRGRRACHTCLGPQDLPVSISPA